MWEKWTQKKAPVETPVVEKRRTPEEVVDDRKQLIATVKWHMDRGEFKEAYGVVEGRRIGLEKALKPVGEQDLDEVGEADDDIIFLNQLDDQINKAEILAERSEAA